MVTYSHNVTRAIVHHARLQLRQLGTLSSINALLMPHIMCVRYRKPVYSLQVLW